ncbi:hypothetical protein BSL78_13920 [Apostichopus japonicus]|uniref:Uncharacterized protein n=1 Tax=Stichopus japonicus TaxID=307972 RepID=A0A2G8KMK7_STIJA|nr:hypothetical protein BSL78_13920 [Apostichopus japonicus]
MNSRFSPTMAESMDANVESASVLKDLQNQIKTAKINLPELSTIAKKGEEKLVEKFLTETVEVKGNPSEVLQSQLYIASFWGFPDVVKTLLQNESLDINYQNKNTLWTPLHAAAFQEHGKVVMMLLQSGAQPELPDAEGRTATDFASASDKIWAHFAAMGCPRTTKETMIRKDIIKKVSAPPTTRTERPTSSTRANMRMAAYSRPDSAYVIRPDAGFSKSKTNNSSQMSALLGGDVLAGENESRHQALNSSQQPSFSIWRT